MVQDEGELVVTTELPGMDPAEIDVSIEGDILTIKGEKTSETKVSEDDRYLHERSFGTFQRRIALPTGTSPDRMSATYDKGVLTVHVTLPEEKKAQALNIPVEVKA